MKARNCRRLHRPILLACGLAMLLPMVVQGGEVDVQGVVQAVQSFLDLATLDPQAAGVVWMAADAAATWRSFADIALESPLAAVVAFGHGVPFAVDREVESGGPLAGMYNPWIGTLFLFSFDGLASAIESFSVHPVEQPSVDAADPASFARALMASIDAVSISFDDAVEGTNPREVATAEQMATAVDGLAAELENAYGWVENPTDAQANLADVLEGLAAGNFNGPLSLLEAEPEIWLNTLMPVWVRYDADVTVLVLASMAAPVDLVWLELQVQRSPQPVLSVSMIRLYDEIVTRGGES